MVISGGGSKASDVLKPKEVVSLLLDDEDIEQRCTFKMKVVGSATSDVLIFSILIPRSTKAAGKTSGSGGETNRKY